MNQIIGIPESEWEYEFTVTKKLPNGDFQWVDSCENYPYKMENKEDIVIFHNLKITHKEKKRK